MDVHVTTEETASVSFLDQSTQISQLDDPNNAAPIWKPWYTYIIIVFILLILVVLVGNILTVVVFFKYMSSAAKTATNYLIVNLSFADIISTLSTSCFVFFNYFPRGIEISSSNKYACLVTLCILAVTFLSSLVTIFALSLQRLLAVLAPFRFKAQKKMPVVLLGIVVPWCLIATCVSLPFFGWNTWAPEKRCTLGTIYTPAYVKHVILIPCTFILLSIPLVNVGIFIALSKRNSKVAAMPSESSNQPAKQKKMIAQIKLKSHREISLMLLSIVGVFYVCISPWLSIFIAGQIDKDIFSKYPNLIVVFEITKLFVYMNGVLNPFIYANRSIHFKEGFRRMFTRA